MQSLLFRLWIFLCRTAMMVQAWIPEEEHPCTVRLQIPSRRSRILRHYFPTAGLVPSLHPEPIVIRRDPDMDVNADFRHRTQPDQIVAWFGPDFRVTLSSSNALSEHRRNTTLAQYIQETVTTRETTTKQRSNESFYLFGETYSEEWRQFLYPNYVRPPCVTCAGPPENVALALGIGNRGSGVQWHVHGPGFSEALHGRKHWILYPPPNNNNNSTIMDYNFDKDQSSRQWMEYVYPTVAVKPVECTLNPGDLIYFPNHWWHATINLDPYTAFISTFTTEHKTVTTTILEMPSPLARVDHDNDNDDGAVVLPRTMEEL